MIKAKIKVALNKRGAPSVNASKDKHYVAGQEVNIVDLINGDMVDGIDVWYKLDNGSFVWSGGVEGMVSLTDLGVQLLESQKDQNEIYDPSKFWWINDFDIDKLWKIGLTGKGIKVAVLDTGLSIPHPDLIVEENRVFDATGSQHGVKDLDGHGTHCSGIIKASNNGFGVKGIAYDCEFFSAKVYDDYDGDKNIETWNKALEWAIVQKVDIISFSRGKQENFSSIEDKIKTALNNNILVVAAAGNNQKDLQFSNIDFPARDQNVLSVGGLMQNKSILASTIDQKSTDLFAPGYRVKSTFKNSKYEWLTGSSQATPFVAGVAALILQKIRQRNKNASAIDVGNKLIDYSSISSDGSYRLINPINTIKNLSL